MRFTIEKGFTDYKGGIWNAGAFEGFVDDEWNEGLDAFMNLDWKLDGLRFDELQTGRTYKIIGDTDMYKYQISQDGKLITDAYDKYKWTESHIIYNELLDCRFVEV
jgi:hypothetical protein